MEEHLRSNAAMAALAAHDFVRVGQLMGESHRGYDAIGLGHKATTATRDAALARAGVYGARASGGGAGGSVVVLCERGALDNVEGLIR